MTYEYVLEQMEIDRQFFIMIANEHLIYGWDIDAV